ncbi:respiratory nitrate reductase subunit gamma [Streptomyces vilmorinianum]|uniref:respiratory nitrate reductase subunit gamma n=1 Tax=Streptomyces vilmorinianum TaxID=3051092 RepID=UPI0010FAD3C2|nr:respiratory nitrate reductase subunit gamma [Streptomyces vilmorinianum]
MRAIRVAPAALLVTATTTVTAAAAVCLGAPTAVADEGTGNNITSFGFSVSPSTVAPGGTVTLKSDGCEVPTVTVSSGVFDTVTLNEGHAGTATVDADAKVGAEYQVTFDCKGEKGTTPLTIAGGSPGHTTGGQTTGGQTTGGQTTGGRTTGGQTTGGHDTGAPKGVKAGFGGGTDALGTTEVVAGSALIAGALGGGVLLMRRRRADGRS